MCSQQIPTGEHGRASSPNPHDLEVEVASSKSSHSESDNDNYSRPSSGSDSSSGGVSLGGVEKDISRLRIYDPFTPIHTSSSRFSSNAGAANEAEVDPDQEFFQDIITATKETHVYGSLVQKLAFFTSDTGVDDKTDAEAEDEGVPNRELFQTAPLIVSTTEETYTYGSLAQELAIFASCLNPSPCPDPLKTPTQSSASEAELQRSQTQALIDKRKFEMTRDLLELIQEEEGTPNWELIESIDRLMRDWRNLHERLERWRRELKGEKVRARQRRVLGH
ncbi:hypothetical protein BKA61DRAFT_678312 [Leptodontidium sp. MPI-SDFR-AT-0119]|nr:hypothetical protein BKA61DRAFT_678312 [Leptodontidium sp. MPI-SDFR-AT-0119]